MYWYSLFVLTGKEESVAEWLKTLYPKLDATYFIPKRKLYERKQGRIRPVLKKMFPGYILIYIEMDSEIYYKLKKVPNLIRILNSGDFYTKIPEEEILGIRNLTGKGDVVDYSRVYVVDSKVIVKSGPLLGKEGIIKEVDKRKLRAKISVQFMGAPKEIDVGIELIDQYTGTDGE